MPQDLYVACRVLMTKSQRHDYVVLRSSEIDWRRDVETASIGFETKAEAEAEIQRLGGSIPKGLDWFLDFFEDDDMEIVWCWKDDRTGGVSQLFASDHEATEAWKKGKLILSAPPLE